MNKRILLLNVPYGELYGKINIRKLGWGVAPLGLAALSAYIREKLKCPVKLIDMLFQDVCIKDIPGILDDFKPDVVGLSATTPQMDNVYLLSQVIKRHNPKIKIVVGGPHVTALPERTLREESSIDFVIAGEGEIPFLSLIKDAPLDSIKSLVWRKGEEIVINEREGLIEDLGSLPFPDYDSLPLRHYGTFYSGHSVGVVSGRGCCYNCSFCASRITHLGRYRMRPVEIFLDDIERLLKLGIPRFDIYDDTFTFSKSRINEFIEGYHRRGLKARWSCTTRVDCLDKKLIRDMRRSGLDLIHIGCESGNQEILNKVGKKIKLEKVTEISKWCQEEGVTVYVYFILGLPYETEKTIMETIDFSKKLPVDFAQFSMLVPLPGTRVWEIAQEGKVIRNLAKRWSDYDRYNKAIVESDKIPSEEITGLYKYALRSFYLRPSYILQRFTKINDLAKAKMYLRMTCEFFKVLKG